MDIHGIWVIGQNGETIYDYELFVQGSEDFNSALIGNFIAGLQQFAVELGKKELKVIELSNSKILIQRDKKSNINFILKCGKSLDNEDVSKFIGNIRNFFTKHFKVDIDDSSKISSKSTLAIERFIQGMLEIEEKSSIEQFLEDL